MENSVLKTRARQLLKANFWVLALMFLVCFVTNYYFSVSTSWWFPVWSLLLIVVNYFVNKSIYYISEVNEKWSYKEVIKSISLENFLEFLVANIMMTIFVALWLLLFIIPGIVKAYSYSLVPYLVANKGYSWRYAFETSIRLMRGKKMDLFMLELSFFLWILTIPLTLGLSAFWVGPYAQLTYYQFFNEVVQENIIKVEPIPNK